ncbi:MAG: Cna B-type domain-containing protein, partial [Lachnospiraceae bacterium]
GYDAAVEGYDITNTYIPENPNPEVIAISGTKTWDDAGYEEHRPESITVNLYRMPEDGAETELVTSQEVAADSEGNWRYTFSDLPMADDNGKLYTYTVSEKEVSGYEAAVEGYDITNTYKPDSDKDKTPNDTTKKGTTTKTTKNATNAKTGDFVNLILLWGILIASAGICGYALWRKFRKLKK